MNKKEQQQKLHKLLEGIKKGQIPLEESLAYFKKHDQVMYTLLKKAALLQNIQLEPPSAEYKRASKARIFNQIQQDLLEEKAAATPDSRNRLFQPRLQTALTVFLVLIVSFGVLIGGAQAADAAAPGDFLYSVDLALEDFRLSLTGDDVKQVGLLMDYSEERVGEATQQFRIKHNEHGRMAIEEYEREIHEVKDIMLKADPKKLAEMQAIVEESSARTAEALTQLMAQLPPELQAVVAHALEVSTAASDPNAPITPLPAIDGIEADDDLGESLEMTEEALEETAIATQEAAEATQEAAQDSGGSEDLSGDDDNNNNSQGDDDTQVDDDDGGGDKPPNPNKPTPRPTNPNRPTQKP